MKKIITKNHILGIRKKRIQHILHSTSWFFVGFTLAAVLLASFIIFYFQHTYHNRVIPGIFVDNIYIGEKNKEEIEEIFKEKNEKIQKNTIIFSTEDKIATISAQTLNIGYDIDLIKEQATKLGKTGSLFSDTYIILSSYINGTFLGTAYTFNEEILKEKLQPIQDVIYKEPVDALFKVNGQRVESFRESTSGQTIDYQKLNWEVENKIKTFLDSEPGVTTIEIPIKTLLPEITTEEVNNFGIVEKIGEGKSTFYNSIASRIHNISLAASRLNGVLIAPGEVFSFATAIGDISKYTGYKEAYIIRNGKTILGDGGGVCQVSTTLFRAILNSGLPIVERHPHSYRVGYYEQDSPPGFDATVYVPSVDLKFRNNTDNHILIQSFFDPSTLSLRFAFYGKSDGRKVEISKPVVTNISSPPEPLYQDDPSLPQGVVKQVEYQAPGARVYISRTVTKNGEVIISDGYSSNYIPWQAVYLRGTGSVSN